MKKLRDIENEQGQVCRVWQSRPVDSKHEHTHNLIKAMTPQGEIKVCNKCHQDILDIVAFQNRRQVAFKESVMVVSNVELRSKKETVERLENVANTFRVRKRAAALQQSLFNP